MQQQRRRESIECNYENLCFPRIAAHSEREKNDCLWIKSHPQMSAVKHWGWKLEAKQKNVKISNILATSNFRLINYCWIVLNKNEFHQILADQVFQNFHQARFTSRFHPQWVKNTAFFGIKFFIFRKKCFSLTQTPRTVWIYGTISAAEARISRSSWKICRINRRK